MMINAVLSNPHHPDYGVVTIPFPIPHDQYAHCIKSKLLRAVLYYITIAFLLLDPLYLSVLCGFFGGGDMNGMHGWNVPGADPASYEQDAPQMGGMTLG